MKLDLDTFPVRADCPATLDFYVALYRALGEAIGVPAGAVPAIGGGCGSRGADWQDPKRTLRGGLRVLGTKRNYRGEVVQVSYALFDDAGAPVAWSGDLDPQWGAPAHATCWEDADGRIIPLTAAMKDALKKLKALTPKRAPADAPFTVDARLMGVALSPDGERCYATDYAGLLHAWEVPGGRELFRARVGAARQWLHHVAVSPDGALVAAGRRKVAVLDARTGAARCTLEGPKKAEVMGVAFSPAGDRVALAAGLNVMGVDNGVSVWDAATGGRASALRLDAMASAVAWEADGASLVVGTAGPGSLRRVDAAGAREALREPLDDWSCDVLVRTSAGWCGVGTGQEVTVFDPRTLKATARYVPPLKLAARVWVAPGPDPDHLLVSSVSGREVAIVEAATGRLARALPVLDFEGDIMGVACSARHAVAATGLRVTHWTL